MVIKGSEGLWPLSFQGPRPIGFKHKAAVLVGNIEIGNMNGGALVLGASHNVCKWPA